MADATDDRPLVPLPPQPDGVPWPTGEWPPGKPIDTVDALIDRVFEDDALATTHAAVVVHRGELIAERYLEADAIGPSTTLISWSMAKSIVHAAVGVLVRDGLLSVHHHRPVP